MASNTGILYCKSNPYYWSPPDHPVKARYSVVKVGIVSAPGRTPEDRRRELFTTGVPAEFKTEFKRKVSSVLEWESWIHRYFELQGLRTHTRREFVIATPDEVRDLFARIPGEWIVEDEVKESEEEDEEEEMIPLSGTTEWSIDGIRKFLDEEWKDGETFFAAHLYDRIAAYCQLHSFSYHEKKEGITTPHVSSLGLILKRFFVETGLVQMRRGNGNKAVYSKPILRE